MERNYSAAEVVLHGGDVGEDSFAFPETGLHLCSGAIAAPNGKVLPLPTSSGSPEKPLALQGSRRAFYIFSSKSLFFWYKNWRNV